jgi:NAD(P)-dependent dehydrogenase (short-subunit alcohol dehydrogenase family)
MKLSGRNAVVTGGTQGLGRAIVEAFLAEGASVAFCARTAAEVAAAQQALEEKLRPGQWVEGHVCDVSEPSAVAEMFTRVLARGPLHVVVSNAAIHGPIGPTESIDIEGWDRAWRINVTGSLLVCQHAVRAMKATGGGRIVTVSGGGAASPRPNFATYAATKAAVVRLTETLAEEVRTDGIAVNAIAPGTLRTRLADEVLAAGATRAGDEAEKLRTALSGNEDLTPARAAALCVYLASDESTGITGKLLSARWDPWENLSRFRAELERDVYTLRRIVPEDRGLRFDA